jgi:hypothetical protein
MQFLYIQDAVKGWDIVRDTCEPWLKLVATPTVRELERALTCTAADGFIHQPSQSDEAPECVLQRARVHPHKQAVIVAPLRPVLDDFLSALPAYEASRFIFLEGYQSLGVRLRAQLIRRPPHSYSFGLLTRRLPNWSTGDATFRAFLERCFIDQDIDSTLTDLCAANPSAERRCRREAQRCGLRNLEVLMQAVRAVRSGHALVELGLSRAMAAAYCGCSVASIRRALRTATNASTVVQWRQLGMAGIIEGAAGLLAEDSAPDE